MAQFKLITDDFNLDVVMKKFQRDKKQLPLILGNLAKNHFISGFNSGGGKTNDSISGWKDRRFRDGGRATLVKSGKLKRDIKVRQKSFRRTVVGTGGMTNDYAEAHNEGTSYAVTAKQRKFFIAQYKNSSGAKKEAWRKMIGAKTITIPKREYIGDSRVLEKKLMNRIYKEVNESWSKSR